MFKSPLFWLFLLVIGLYVVGPSFGPPFNIVSSTIDGALGAITGGGSTPGVAVPLEPAAVAPPASSAPVIEAPVIGSGGGSGFDFSGAASSTLRSAGEQVKAVGDMRPLQAVENPFSASIKEWAIFLGFSSFLGWLLFLLAGKGVKKGQDLATTVKAGLSLRTTLITLASLLGGGVGYLEFKERGLALLSDTSGLLVGVLIILVVVVTSKRFVQALTLVAANLVIVAGGLLLVTTAFAFILPYAEPQYTTQVASKLPAEVQFVLSITRSNPTPMVVLGVLPFVFWWLFSNSSPSQGGGG